MAVSKYRSKKVMVDGIKFDSIAESKFYKLLKDLKEKGLIKDFSLQPVYQLQPPFKKFGKRYLAIKYVADFIIIKNDGTELVIDVKGLATETAKMKRKMFDYCYPDKTLVWITESVKYGKGYGWVDVDELAKIRKENKKNAKKLLEKY